MAHGAIFHSPVMVLGWAVCVGQGAAATTPPSCRQQSGFNPAPAWSVTVCGWHPSHHLLHCPSSHPLNLPAAGLFSRTRCHPHRFQTHEGEFLTSQDQSTQTEGFMKARWVWDPTPHIHLEASSRGVMALQVP